MHFQAKDLDGIWVDKHLLMVYLGHWNRKTNEGKNARLKVIGKECEQIAEVIYSKIKDDLEEIVRKAF